MALFLKRVLLGLLAVLTLKIFFAYVDGEEVRYVLLKTGDPERFGTGFYRYQLRGDKIIGLSKSGYVFELQSPKCKVWDEKNWVCQREYSNDDYVREEMGDGNYEEWWPLDSDEEHLERNLQNDVSPLTYLIRACKNQFEEGVLWGVIGCPFEFYRM